LATVVLILALWITNNIFARIYQQLKAWGESYIHPVRFGNWKLIRANQLDNILIWLFRLAQAAIILGLLVAYFPFVLEQFPWTRGLAKTLKGYLVGRLQSGWQAFVNYLPSLLTIVLVVVVTVFLVRLSKPFFRELGQGTFVLPGFYPEWADPTQKLVTFLIIALATVIAFPLLPGFQSPAFQGISVFLGLLISLGSTSVISNLVSGSVLIYTRAFKVGDRIKISFGYRELKQPFIVRTPVYLGYEVPWREAYQALSQAPLRTEGMLKSPEPFVLQGGN
jgi:small-conductance mechanosensitive channel